MGRTKKVDFTSGPMISTMLTYAFPIILGSLIQVAFNAADLIVVGKMGGTVASAAVGAVSPVVNILVNSFIGLSVGINAVLARSLGQKDTARVGRVINTSLIFAFVLGLFLVVSCFLFSKPLLRTLNCDDAYIDYAILYMNIYAVGIPAILTYNFSSAIIRSMGDTTRPFIYLVIAGIVNVGLNLVLCLILENKVAAVAIATTVSQLIGAILTFIHLVRLDGGMGFNIKKLSFSFRELGAMLKVGMPSAFNTALYALSNLQMAAAINAYGTAATAGSAAAINVESICGAFTAGFNSTTVPFVGQNVGAGNRKRVRQSIVCAMLSSIVIVFFVSMSIYLFKEQILQLYLPVNESGAEAVSMGIARMKYVCRFYTICSVSGVVLAAMQAFGYSFVPMINSIITVFGFRIFWLEVVYPILDAKNHVIDNVYLCFTVSWILTLIANVIAFCVVYIGYKKGKVKQI